MSLSVITITLFVLKKDDDGKNIGGKGDCSRDVVAAVAPVPCRDRDDQGGPSPNPPPRPPMLLMPLPPMPMLNTRLHSILVPADVPAVTALVLPPPEVTGVAPHETDTACISSQLSPTLTPVAVGLIQQHAERRPKCRAP